MKDYNGQLRQIGVEALARGDARGQLRAQLRSSVLRDQISAAGQAVAYTYDAAALRRGLTLARLGELTRTPRERRADPGALKEIAETYADLAEQLEAGDPQRVELLAIAATMWSLAGYQANSVTVAWAFLTEVQQVFSTDERQVDYRRTRGGEVDGPPMSTTATAPYRLALLTASVLRRDIDEVARLGEQSAGELRALGTALVGAVSEGQAEQADAAVLAAYGLVGRAARHLVRLWRGGDRADGRAAVADLRQAARVVLDASVADTWTLVDSLAHAVEDIVATSPWLLLRRASTWGPVWERYLKALIVAGRPMVQVWPSQRAALDAGLLDRRAASLTVAMPTSAGKTHIAEWAILHALAAGQGAWWDPRRLTVYVVPTRALAAQVERHLGDSLELVGLRVSSLFGGAEHVRYEAQLLDFTDILVVTSEKLDLLLRNVPGLMERLSLVLVDEGHLIDASERGLRLEMLLTRIRRDAPTARIIILSAVLPNGEDLARWLEPAASGKNLVTVDWTPSQLRTGVFYWRGTEQDGQSGTIDYGTQGGNDFFLPRVLTRHRKRTRLFPSDAKDVAAGLALHFERLGPVLISSPTKIKARAAARSLGIALKGQPRLGAGSDGTLDTAVAAQRAEAATDVAQHIGLDHELVLMVLQGFGYHHSEVPMAVRHRLERAYREGVLRVLCATSTLSQGMNLPTKTVLVPDVWRGQNDQVSVRDFWNTAGRAGRAFHETEGHVILIAKDRYGASQIRKRYLDRGNIEPIFSTLTMLYVNLVRARLGRNPGSGEDLSGLDFTDPETGKSEIWAAGLDIQLLALLAEEVVDTPDQNLLEQAARDLLTHTLGGHQLGTNILALDPLARFSARRVATLARQLPDRAARAAIVRTGLSVQGGMDSLTAAEAIATALDADPTLLTADGWPTLQNLVVTAATAVRELKDAAAQKKIPVSAVPALARDWIAGTPPTELHQRHRLALGTKDITETSAVVDRVLTQDLAWVVSALLQLLELRHGELADGALSALPAMIKYGVGSPAACYACSIGVHDRTASIALASHCPAQEPTFGTFLDWLSQLTADDITAISTPDTAALLIRSAERRSPRIAQTTILNGVGMVLCALRGIRHAASASLLAQLRIGQGVTLVRDRSNRADPNAVRVLYDDAPLGWVAREIARPLAIVMDQIGSPTITARLATDTYLLGQEPDGRTQLETHNAVELALTLSLGTAEASGATPGR